MSSLPGPANGRQLAAEWPHAAPGRKVLLIHVGLYPRKMPASTTAGGFRGWLLTWHQHRIASGSGADGAPHRALTAAGILADAPAAFMKINPQRRAAILPASTAASSPTPDRTRVIFDSTGQARGKGGNRGLHVVSCRGFAGDRHSQSLDRIIDPAEIEGVTGSPDPRASRC